MRPRTGLGSPASPEHPHPGLPYPSQTTQSPPWGALPLPRASPSRGSLPSLIIPIPIPGCSAPSSSIPIPGCSLPSLEHPQPGPSASLLPPHCPAPPSHPQIHGAGGLRGADPRVSPHNGPGGEAVEPRLAHPGRCGAGPAPPPARRDAGCGRQLPRTGRRALGGAGEGTAPTGGLSMDTACPLFTAFNNKAVAIATGLINASICITKTPHPFKPRRCARSYGDPHPRRAQGCGDTPGAATPESRPLLTPPSPRNVCTSACGKEQENGGRSVLRKIKLRGKVIFRDGGSKAHSKAEGVRR